MTYDQQGIITSASAYEAVGECRQKSVERQSDRMTELPVFDPCCMLYVITSDQSREVDFNWKEWKTSS